ncbi:MAG TPA: PspC domain-containing protein [Gaiella sp.]
MNDTTAATAPPVEERRLVRPADDRIVAGVCAGLGRYFGVNPLVYRVALAGLVLLGGIGLIVYGAAWLVIPDERRGDSIVGEALRDHRRRPWLTVGVGLVAIALLLGIVGSDVFPDPGNEWLIALLVGLAIVSWQLRDRPSGGPGGAAATAATVEDVTREGPPPAGPETAPPGAPEPPRRQFPIFLPTVGVVLAGVGVLGVLDATDTVDVNWTVALAVGVAIVGVAVAVGAFFGGTAWLAVVGLLLAGAMVVASVVNIPLNGPIGERNEHPTSVRELQDSYAVSIGQLDLDLSDLVLPRGTTEVKGSVGIGQMTVVVPRGVRVEVDAHVTAGDSTAFGESFEGRGFDRVFVDESAGPNAPKLFVEADVGLGELVVQRG